MTTTFDKELLELAAKAAGYTFDSTEPFEIAVEHKGGTDWYEWNPLTDDGDAFRLAVKLGLTVCVSFKYGLTWADKDDKGHALAKSNHDGDKFAATRRAIVLAAAEIGKNAA